MARVSNGVMANEIRPVRVTANRQNDTLWIPTAGVAPRMSRQSLPSPNRAASTLNRFKPL
jgi:hypothetical protein